jgi:DNA-directed RNA polymerase subunit F
MSRKSLKGQLITIPKVKEILESLGKDKLDQFQRRSFDYASKFSKVDPNMAEKLVNEITKDFQLEKEEAVQIVNCMPESIEELRVFLIRGRRIFETSNLERLLSLLDKNRK